MSYFGPSAPPVQRPVQQYSQPQPQQYPPPGYQPYAPPEKDSFPWTIVVIVVALVILVPAILAVAWMMLAGIPVDVDTDKTTVIIASPSVESRTIGEEVHWDVTLNIVKITPRDEAIAWGDVRIIVKSSAGSVLLPATRPSWDDPAEYDDGSDGTVDVEAWYVCTDSGPNMRAGDAIKLTGMTLDYEGGNIEITQRGERIGSMFLPTDFP
jgi:hypothetical protein